ncbi:cysteine--tRNA ligase, partial [Bordetella bronchiseptica]
EAEAELTANLIADVLDNPRDEASIAERAAAKAARDFARADAIRAELRAAGVELDDKPGGLTQWRRA